MRGLREEYESWNTICTWRRSASTAIPEEVPTGSPSNTNSPASGLTRCSSSRAKVDLPQPDSQSLALADGKRHAVDRLHRLAAAPLHRKMLAQITGDHHRLMLAAAVTRIVHRRSHGYIRTSIAARRPSLTRLQQIEVMKIATPGRAHTKGTT
jgi:hypothetical protein